MDRSPCQCGNLTDRCRYPRNSSLLEWKPVETPDCSRRTVNVMASAGGYKGTNSLADYRRKSAAQKTLTHAIPTKH